MCPFTWQFPEGWRHARGSPVCSAAFARRWSRNKRVAGDGVHKPHGGVCEFTLSPVSEARARLRAGGRLPGSGRGTGQPAPVGTSRRPHADVLGGWCDSFPVRKPAGRWGTMRDVLCTDPLLDPDSPTQPGGWGAEPGAGRAGAEQTGHLPLLPRPRTASSGRQAFHRERGHERPRRPGAHFVARAREEGRGPRESPRQ